MEATVKERNDQLEQLKTTAGNIKELQAQITSLQEENKKKDACHLNQTLSKTINIYSNIILPTSTKCYPQQKAR